MRSVILFLSQNETEKKGVGRRNKLDFLNENCCAICLQDNTKIGLSGEKVDAARKARFMGIPKPT
jgi:hypothetical protein